MADVDLMQIYRQLYYRRGDVIMTNDEAVEVWYMFSPRVTKTAAEFQEWKLRAFLQAALITLMMKGSGAAMLYSGSVTPSPRLKQLLQKLVKVGKGTWFDDPDATIYNAVAAQVARQYHDKFLMVAAGEAPPVR